ncbi:hypothetical protein B0G38_002550 [Arthrobacter sp. VKM Ac-2550]|nr:hypothetical protein [Arthrobacter sp. VKM Ac-2550]
MTMGEWFTEAIFGCFHSPGLFPDDRQRPVRIAEKLRDRTGISVSYVTKEALRNDLLAMGYEETAQLYEELSDCVAEEGFKELHRYQVENPPYRVIQA